MKLLVIDGNSLLNRAFYGIRILTAKDGTNTNAVYGFLNILMKLIEETQPYAIAVAFDVKQPTFRHKAYADYKAGRKSMPPELAEQFPIVKQLLSYLGYTVIECPGYEADDILGTLADECTKAGNECILATGDRDSLQLVSELVTVRLASGKGDVTIYDNQAIIDKYGVTPAQLIDVKALMGDSSDNIPGVSGIGEKTALSLIQNNHSLDELYDNIQNIKLTPSVRLKLQRDKDMAYQSYDLAKICRESPIPRDINYYKPNAMDVEKASILMTRLGLNKLMQRLNLKQSCDISLESIPTKINLPQITIVDSMPKINSEVMILMDIENDDIKAFTVIGDGVVFLVYEEIRQVLEQIFSTGAKIKTHACKLLFRYGYVHGVEIPNVVFDAELAEYLINPIENDYTISILCEKYNLIKPEIVGSFPQEYVHLVENSAMLFPLINVLQNEINQNQQLSLLSDIEIPLARVLASMEIDGVELDGAGLEEFGYELDKSIATLQQSIYSHAEMEFNINSPKQLGDILFEKLGLPTRKKNKTGYSTNVDVLHSLMDKHPIIAELLEYRTLAKLKSTYVDGLLKVLGQDGRIHTFFRQTETRTGRISSVEPNMQNIPIRSELGSRLRKYFRARNGYKLVGADYSQIELRVLAHIANDTNMIKAFKNNEDIHTQTAAQVFDMPVDFVTSTMRSRAKAVNFGIVYGIGAFSLSHDIGVSITQADDYIKSYLSTYRGVKQYMDDIISYAKNNGFVTTLFGRRRPIPELSVSNKNTIAFGERIAMNTPIQGTAADIIKMAMVKVFKRIQKEGLLSKLVLQIHDELIIEAIPSEVERIKLILREEMENAVELLVPLNVDVNVGDTWFEI